EDGIRDLIVTGVQTCALPISSVAHHDLFVSPIRYRYYHEDNAFNDELDPFMHKRLGFAHEREVRLLKYDEAHYRNLAAALIRERSEERRVGKECRGREWEGER